MNMISVPRPAVRERLLERIALSARASRQFVTVRWQPEPTERPAPGVEVRTLYEGGPGPRRAGEPLRVRLIQLAAGACWNAQLAARHGEWLLMRGAARLGSLTLQQHDYHRADGADLLSSEQGALVYLRESAPLARPALTRRDADGGWDDFAPGIRRRLLSDIDGEAALLYRAAPGAAVPRHGHRHDDECLMLEGELFLDDLLLRRGDYQIAPAGTVHGAVLAETGVLLFAHGDIELDVLAA
jgi:quercetin dioxygenase-like cupin family protein